MLENAAHGSHLPTLIKSHTLSKKIGKGHVGHNNQARLEAHLPQGVC